MALAAGSIVSTTVVGAVVLAVRSIWKKKKAGGGCGCGCSGCNGMCPSKNLDTDRR